MINYLNIFKAIFKDIIEKYNFQVIEINEFTFALVGNKFSIIVDVGYDGANLDYIMPDAKGELIRLPFSFFIYSKVDDNDGIGLKKSTTIYQLIINALTLLESVLINHCDNILRGDQSWISDYVKYSSEERKKFENEYENKIDGIEYGDDFEKVRETDDEMILKPIFDKQ